jgi:hypothetical protein
MYYTVILDLQKDKKPVIKMNQMKKYQTFHHSGFERLERQKVFKDIYLSPAAFH